MDDYTVRYASYGWIVEDPDGYPVCDQTGRVYAFDRVDDARMLAATLRQERL